MHNWLKHFHLVVWSQLSTFHALPSSRASTPYLLTSLPHRVSLDWFYTLIFARGWMCLLTSTSLPRHFSHIRLAISMHLNNFSFCSCCFSASPPAAAAAVVLAKAHPNPHFYGHALSYIQLFAAPSPPFRRPQSSSETLCAHPTSTFHAFKQFSFYFVFQL